MKDAVIGRMKIDNYLLSLMYETGGTLIDATYRVTAVHLGLDGYMEKRRYKKQKQNDMMWNRAYIPSMYIVKGSLQYAKWTPRGPGVEV